MSWPAISSVGDVGNWLAQLGMSSIGHPARNRESIPCPRIVSLICGDHMHLLARFSLVHLIFHRRWTCGDRRTYGGRSVGGRMAFDRRAYDHSSFVHPACIAERRPDLRGWHFDRTKPASPYRFDFGWMCTANSRCSQRPQSASVFLVRREEQILSSNGELLNSIA